MAHSLEKFRILGLLTVKNGRYVEEDPQVVRPRMPDIQNTSGIPNYLSATFSIVYNVRIATTGRYDIYYDPAEYHRAQKYTIYDIKHSNIPLWNTVTGNNWKENNVISMNGIIAYGNNFVLADSDTIKLFDEGSGAVQEEFSKWIRWERKSQL